MAATQHSFAQVFSAASANDTVQLDIDAAASMSAELMTRIEAACRQAEEGTAHRVLLIRMLGHPECCGTQVWPGDVDIHLIGKWEQALRRIERSNAITIAVVEHLCSIAALEVLLSTDFRIASSSARVQLVAPARPIWPGMWMYRATNQLGLKQARQLLMSGTEISAEQALQIGIVDVVAKDVQGTTQGLLARIHSMDASHLAMCRRLMLEAPSTAYEDALGSYLAGCHRALKA